MSLRNKLLKNQPVAFVGSPSVMTSEGIQGGSLRSKLLKGALRSSENVAVVSPSVNLGVTVSKTGGFTTITPTAPLPSPVAINIQPIPESGGGIITNPISFTDVSSSSGEGFMEDQEEAKPYQKKVSSWLSKFLPTVETDVNFPDKKPLYILIGGIIVSIIIFKLIKKR